MDYAAELPAKASGYIVDNCVCSLFQNFSGILRPLLRNTKYQVSRLSATPSADSPPPNVPRAVSFSYHVFDGRKKNKQDNPSVKPVPVPALKTIHEW